MTAAWNPSIAAAGEPADAQATRQALAPLVVYAAVGFNFVLCFVNTHGFGVSTGLVISTEIGLNAMAFGLICDRSRSLHAILLLLAAYFVAVMVMRADFDAKVVRDLLIPIVFCFLGRHLGLVRSADRLVTVLIVIALGTSLFEWLALDTYLRFFDVIHYYVARGTVTEDTHAAAGLFFNGIRPEPRTLLPFLGDHRASGIFLEPVSVGNFGAIAFAWVLLRDRRRFWVFAGKTFAIATILVLADARFGFYLCFLTLALYFVAPVIRPTMLLALPFAAMIALVTYAGAHWQDAVDNTIAGRFLSAGDFLSSLDPWRVFGLQTNDALIGYGGNDAGYGYLLAKLGLLGVVAIWTLFSYSPVLDRDGWRFKTFIAFYIVLILSDSASLFTIKTAALLWFLYGTLNNPNRASRDLRGPRSLG